jgi:catechol 2,3-dioxygenase-like lactoylglutathione lyase family enzyme
MDDRSEDSNGLSLQEAASVIKVTGIAYARLNAPDLDRMEQFLLDFGLQRAARTERALYMRGADQTHHIHITELGDERFVGMAFNAASEADLHTLAQQPGASSVEAMTSPGGGKRVRLTDPNGYQIEVVHGIDRHAPIVAAGFPINTNLAPLARPGTTTRLQAGPSKVLRIGHVVMATPRLEATLDWFRRTLGLIATDEVFADDETNVVGSFNRCDLGEEHVDHHVTMFFSNEKAGLNHLAFEVVDIDDVFMGHEHLQRVGSYEHMYGVGRHLLGSQVFDYWADPWGRVHEHWTDTDRFTAATPIQRMDIREGFVSQWGGEPPEKLLVRISP